MNDFFVVLLCSYKHAINGLIRVIQEEGVQRLFSGCSTATGRAILMTIGQLSFYDQIKMILLTSGYFTDNPTTHIISSVCAVRSNFFTIFLLPIYYSFLQLISKFC